MLTVVELGPSPKLRGIITSPGANVSLKLPNGVHLMFTVSEQSAPAGASAGRSIFNVLPLISRPSVILNGRPDCTITNGFSVMPHVARKLPVITKRCLISFDARPYSVLRSYGFAGKLPMPSVSLFAFEKT